MQKYSYRCNDCGVYRWTFDIDEHKCSNVTVKNNVVYTQYDGMFDDNRTAKLDEGFEYLYTVGGNPTPLEIPLIKEENEVRNEVLDANYDDGAAGSSNESTFRNQEFEDEFKPAMTSTPPSMRSLIPPQSGQDNTCTNDSILKIQFDLLRVTQICIRQNADRKKVKKDLEERFDRIHADYKKRNDDMINKLIDHLEKREVELNEIKKELRAVQIQKDIKKGSRVEAESERDYVKEDLNKANIVNNKIISYVCKKYGPIPNTQMIDLTTVTKYDDNLKD